MPVTKSFENSGYLLDSCIVSHWFKGTSSVVDRINQFDSDSQLFVSAITLGEIEFGYACGRTSDFDKEIEFRRWMNEHFEDNRLAVSKHTGEYYGKFKSELYRRHHPDRKKGKRFPRPETLYDSVTGQSLEIDENDLWLVSQAAERNLIFVTTDRMSRIREIVGDEANIDFWAITSD